MGRTIAGNATACGSRGRNPYTSRVATRSRNRNRAFLILLVLWTVPAVGMTLFFLLTDQHGHPPAAFLAGPVVLIWIVGAVTMFTVWSIMGAADR